MLPALEAKKVVWKQVTHEDVKYVSLKQVGDFYDLKMEVKKKKKVALLKNAVAELKFTEGQPEIWLNGYRLVANYPVRKLKGGLYLAARDFSEVLDPIVRPSTTSVAKVFDTVIIDPGHGGHDSGVLLETGSEAQYTLKLGLKLKEELEARKLKVVMTRKDDSEVSLLKRSEMIQKTENAIVVSLHFGEPSEDKKSPKKGMRTYALSPVETLGGVARGKLAARSTGLACALQWQLMAQLKLEAIEVDDLGVWQSQDMVVAELKHPAILFEGGFLTDPDDFELIGSELYHEVVSKALADGIGRYRAAIQPLDLPEKEK